MKKNILTAVPVALALFAGAATAQAAILDANLNVSSSTSGTGVNVNVGSNINGTLNSSDSGTSADLDTYVQTMSSTNADVKAVDTTDDDKVVVEYKRPAKLFGFIDVDLTEKAVVKAEDDGSRKASVSKSWWSIFAADDTKTSEFSDTLKARIEASGSASASGTETLTASEKAEYIAEINAAANATYSAN